jgi:stringent starvation protein B
MSKVLMLSHVMKDVMMHGVENLDMYNDESFNALFNKANDDIKIIPLVTRMVVYKLNYFICIGLKVT